MADLPNLQSRGLSPPLMPDDVLSPPRHASATAQALRRLRHLVITGELSPGEQIRQQEMADRFGLSRVPLREAMNVLANQGLLLHRPHQGYFVAKRAPGELAQIRRMLHALENELIDTVRWPDAATLAQLRAMNQRMGRYVDREDWSELAILNEDFHFRIFSLSPDHLILGEVQRLWSLIQPFALLKFDLPHARAVTVQEHDFILDTLDTRDRVAFRHVMDVHRSSSARSLAQALSGARDPHGLGVPAPARP